MSTNKRTPSHEQIAAGPHRRLSSVTAWTLGGLGLLSSQFFTAGCGPSAKSDVKPGGAVTAANTGGSSAPVRVRSFSDSRPVKSLAAAAGRGAVPHGLHGLSCAAPRRRGGDRRAGGTSLEQALVRIDAQPPFANIAGMALEAPLDQQRTQHFDVQSCFF